MQRSDRPGRRKSSIRVRQEALDLIQRIESDRNFLPKEGPLCDWCDYQSLCPKRKHLVLVENLPPNEYLREEGVTLVNRYVELREKKRIFSEEIDGELAKIEEALFSYGQKERVGDGFWKRSYGEDEYGGESKVSLQGRPEAQGP